jgi:hypothetical protein
VVVGQTTLEPGESTTIYTDIVMHPGMEGKHLFEIPLKTNDPTQNSKNLRIASNWGPF